MNKVRMAAIVCVALEVAVSAKAQTASFDCSKATQPIEQLVCGNPTLSELDAKLAATFKQAIDGSQGDRDALLASQRQWLRNRIPTCQLPKVLPPPAEREGLEQCVADAYQARISSLSNPATIPTGTNSPCEAAAQRLRDRAAVAGTDWASPINLLDGSVRLDTGSREDPKVLVNRLRSEFRASRDLMEELEDWEDAPWVVALHRLGRTAIYAVERETGTAHCSHFVFFSANKGGAQLSDAPPVVKEDDGTGLCWTTQAWLGEVGGSPAFVVQDNGDDLAADIGITPYRDGGWGSECHVIARFSARFKVAERFCHGIDCGKVAPIATKLAIQYDADPSSLRDTEQVLTSKTLPDFKKMKALADAEGWNVELPTFGEKAASSYTGFDPETVTFPVSLEGQAFLARTSHASFGWRESPDLLFALYRLGDGKLEPVAGLRVEKTRGALTTVEVPSSRK